MPIAAPIAAALTTAGAHPWSLLLGGLDVIREPGVLGFGTPIESIAIREEGPGGVSSAAFDVNDPGATVWPAEGDPVVYTDPSDNVLFRGTVDHWESLPAFGTGRLLRVTATGIDALLDWRYIPPIVIGSGTALASAIAQLANLEVGELRAPDPQGAGGFPPASLRNGNAAWPIGFLQSSSPSANALINGTWTWPGGTLREAINSLAAQAVYIGAGNITSYGVPIAVAVDTSWRLRVWVDTIADQPDDYTSLTVVDTAAGPVRAEDLRFASEPGDVIHQVYIAGASAAASGWFGDGRGIANGRETGISDSSIATFDAAATRAAGYLAQQAGVVRGSFRLEDWTPTAATIHAGSLVSITDAPANATGIYRIFAIAKSFNPSGRQTWSVEFGGRMPSVANLARRLTRSLV